MFLENLPNMVILEQTVGCARQGARWGVGHIHVVVLEKVWA